jgi:hypothetical protein
MQIIDLAHTEDARKAGKDVLELDSTQVATWMECEMKWNLGYNEHLISLGSEAKHFGKGKVIHTLLENFYEAWPQEIPNRQDAMMAAIVATQEWIQNPKTENEKIDIDDSEWKYLVRRFMSYVQFYHNENVKAVGVEVGFSVPLLDTKQALYVLSGRIDFIGEENGRKFWRDYKSQARDYEYYKMKPQFMNYCVALGCNVGVVDYFGLQESEPKKGWFRRQAFQYTQAQLDRWKFQLITIFAAIAKAKRENRYEQNWEMCKHGLNYKCPYTQICEQTTAGAAREVKALYFREREPWSPWSVEENGA